MNLTKTFCNFLFLFGSLVAVHRLLIAVASCCRARAQQLWCNGLSAPLHVGSSWTRDQLALCLLHWQVDSLLLSHQGSPSFSFLRVFRKIPWMEEHGRLQSMGSLGVRHNWATSLSRIGEGNGNPLQCSCLENPRDSGLLSMGLHRVGHDWSNLPAAAAGSL